MRWELGAGSDRVRKFVDISWPQCFPCSAEETSRATAQPLLTVRARKRAFRGRQSPSSTKIDLIRGRVIMRYTRRDFAKFALSVVPAAGMVGEFAGALLAAPAKVDSKVNGVQIGMNVPYNFSDMTMSGDDILARCVTLNC